MSDTSAPGGPAPTPPPRASRWRDARTAAAIMTVTLPPIAAAAGRFLLRPRPRAPAPRMIAVFLASVLLPPPVRLRRRVGSPASLGILAGTTAALLLVLAFVIYASVLGLNDDLPRLHA